MKKMGPGYQLLPTSTSDYQLLSFWATQVNSTQLQGRKSEERKWGQKGQMTTSQHLNWGGAGTSVRSKAPDATCRYDRMRTSGGMKWHGGTGSSRHLNIHLCSYSLRLIQNNKLTSSVVFWNSSIFLITFTHRGGFFHILNPEEQNLVACKFGPSR